MPSYGTISCILFAIPLLCGLHGCMSDAEIGAIYRQRQEQTRLYDSLAATPGGAFDYFRKVDIIGGGGRGSVSFPIGTAFRTLLAQPDATEFFTRLIREGGSAGRIYGLAGLRMTDTVLFARELPAFLASTDSVEFVMGCFGWNRPVAQIAMRRDEPPSAETWDFITEDIYSGTFITNMILVWK